jgi:ABC-type transport system involved in multi-copper enzyme maturation permease subunit
MSLVRAELRRLFKRRVTRGMLALVVALMAAVAVVTAVNHQKPGPAALAEAEAQAARQFEEQQRWIEQDIAACEEAQAAGDAEEMGWPEDCEEIRAWATPQAEMVEWFMPPTFEFREDFPEMILVFAGLLGLFSFFIGASFVGAEWRSGGMMNLLLWRPRRLQVLGAKLGALLGALLGLGIGFGALWVGAFWLVATFRGVTDTMTSGAWQSIGLTGLRGLTLALAAGAIGFGLASLGRHTAMAMGSAIAAFVVGVAGVSIIAGGMLQLRYWEAWLWTTYITAWMDKSVELVDWNAPCRVGGTAGECVQPTLEITWQTAGLGLAAVVAVVLATAAWHMRRRDVT